MLLSELVKIIDHTSIWPKASFNDIKKLCSEAKKYKFGCVCVNPRYVKYAVKLLKGFPVKVGSTCGFPFGANRTDIKVLEAEKAIKDGAKEIDMVINIGMVKSGKYKDAKNDIKAVANVCKRNNVLCKVILEMSLLSHNEKVQACRAVRDSGADFLKTETGLWGKAVINDVKLMKKIAGKKAEVKASGGIRTYKQTEEFIKAGAARIGTSAGVKIVKDFIKNAAYRGHFKTDKRGY